VSEDTVGVVPVPPPMNDHYIKSAFGNPFPQRRVAREIYDQMRKHRVLFRTLDPVEHTQISIEVRDPPASESVIDYDSDYDSTASVPIETCLTEVVQSEKL
jgi:hypothetical protein